MIVSNIASNVSRGRFRRKTRAKPEMGSVAYWESKRNNYGEGVMDTNDIKNKAQDWEQSARERGEELQEEASRWQQKAKEKAKEIARNAGTAADRYVHDNPWVAIASVAVVSFTLGALLARRGD